MDPEGRDQDGGGEWPSEVPPADRVPGEWSEPKRRRFSPARIAAIVGGAVLVGVVLANVGGAPGDAGRRADIAVRERGHAHCPAEPVSAAPPPSVEADPRRHAGHRHPGRRWRHDPRHGRRRRRERVRIIGLDSPETSKPGTPVECFAKEATAAAKALLSPGDAITLQPDPTQDTRDRFDRLLAHVLLADGSLFAEHMIAGGWAVHYIYDGVPLAMPQEPSACATIWAGAGRLGLTASGPEAAGN